MASRYSGAWRRQSEDEIHKACIARLFERNDVVLDAETIADVATSLDP
jgi:hypothetical protein